MTQSVSQSVRDISSSRPDRGLAKRYRCWVNARSPENWLLDTGADTTLAERRSSVGQWIASLGQTSTGLQAAYTPEAMDIATQTGSPLSANFKESHQQDEESESDISDSELAAPDPRPTYRLPCFKYSFGLPQSLQVREENGRVLVTESDEQKRKRVEALFNVTQSAMGATPSLGNGLVVEKAVSGPRSLIEKVPCDPLEAARIRALLDSSSESEEEGPIKGNEGDKGYSAPVISTERTNFFPVDCFDEGSTSDNPPVQAYETVSAENSENENNVMTG